MALTYQVKARIVDLTADKPKAIDRWLIDTNVLFWLSYTNASYAKSGPKQYQLTDYEKYLKAVTQAGGLLFWCGLSFSELAHRIEQTEFEIAKAYGATKATNAKAHRHDDPAEWQRVVGEIASAWDLVKSVAKPIPAGAVIDEKATQQALTDMPNSGLGGYDIFFVQLLTSGALTGILSDDGDFCTVPNITLCTANQSVLAAAKAQKKIVTR